MERRSRFEYGAEVFETLLPARAWTPGDETVGGQRIAAAGVPASYTVRRDSLLSLTLRLWEAEWPDLLALVTYGQTAQALTWFPDAEDLGTSFLCYLHTPAAGDRWGPQRDGAYPRVLEMELTLRGAAGAVPWAAYFL